MTTFEIHSKSTAPPKSAALLERTEKGFGFIPNLIGKMAESPAVAKAYLTLGPIFDESSFSPTERQIVLLAVSRFHECHYCMAAHSAIAQMQDVPPDVVEALRSDRPISDRRLEALRAFTTRVVEQRGNVSDQDMEAFIDAGFTKAQVLEAMLGVALKTLSNYVNHVADTPLDTQFAAKRWTAGSEAA